MSGAAGPGGGIDCPPGDGCITCGDVAVPLTVLRTVGADARCRDERGREETVAVELVGPVTAGDVLLVHAGVALERLEPPYHTAPLTEGDPDALRR